MCCSLQFEVWQGARNILLDSGGQLKVAGFGLIKLSKIAPDKFKLAHPRSIDQSSKISVLNGFSSSYRITYTNSILIFGLFSFNDRFVRGS